MNPPPPRRTARRIFGVGPLAITLLLPIGPASGADTPYTATGWIVGVPVPGLWCTNALGQVAFRGNAHLVRVESTQPRLTGRRTIFVDGAAQADGSSLLWGPAYHEVGTWDGTGTNFTPTGGLWETRYRGTMAADGSLNLHSVGYGGGGNIDGLRLDETLTRDFGAILDPTMPYHYTGAIKAPPLTTNLVLEDFSGPPVGWDYYGTGYSYTRSNGQLVVTGYWPGIVTRFVTDTYTFGGPRTEWTAAEGQTVEGRADLVSFNAGATAARLVVGSTSGFYSMFKGRDFVAVSKWSSSLPSGPVIMFFFQEVVLPDTNVILSLALTRTNLNVVITARVLTKGSPGSVLYARSVVDTPNADPALTSAEFLSLSGLSLGLSFDLVAAPFFTARAGIGVWQYNNDGQRPAAEAVFDNLELRKYEVPEFNIARAVHLSWPVPAGVTYSVETALAIRGPWWPVQELAIPGLQCLTVPHSKDAGFFRLRPAP